MADKSPVGYLPSTSPEAMEANRAYQEALTRLNESLDMRKNRILDPRWAAVTKAFSTPGQTGSGAETIGRVMGALGEAETGMALEEQNIAQRKVDVANQNMLMERQRQLYKMHEQDQTSGAPAGGALSAASAPGGGESQDTGIPFMPPLGAMSEKQFGRAMLMDSPNVSPADIAKAYADYRTKFFQKAEGYTLDTATGLLRRIPTGKLVPSRIPGPGKNQVYEDISDFDAVLFETLPESDPRVQRALKKYFPDYVALGAENAPSIEPTRVTGAKPTGVTPPPGAPKGMETKPEREARLKKEDEERLIRLEGAKSEASKLGEKEAERKSTIIDSAISSGEILRPLKVLKTIAANPNAEKFLGIFARGDVFSSLAGLVESGIGIPGYSIGIPEIRKALTTTNLTTDEIRDYQTALQILTNFQLQMSKYAKGSVSNFEQNLFKASTLNIEDTPKTLLYKINLAELGAQFQRDQAALYKSMKKPNTEDFYLSRSYRKLEERYNGLMDAVLAGQGFEIPSGKSQPQPGSKGGKKPSHDELSSALDQLIGGR